jgi:hypothetical protein
MMPMRSKLGQRVIVTDLNGMVVADSSGTLTGKKADIDLTDASSAMILADNEQQGTLYIVSRWGWSGILGKRFYQQAYNQYRHFGFIYGIICFRAGPGAGKKDQRTTGRVVRSHPSSGAGKAG